MPSDEFMNLGPKPLTLDAGRWMVESDRHSFKRQASSVESRGIDARRWVGLRRHTARRSLSSNRQSAISSLGPLMATVVLEKVVKEFPGGVIAVREIDLRISDAEFVVLVGPSGCGKSTTLRMVAGLEEITRGTIRIDDRVVNGIPPKDRDIAMLRFFAPDTEGRAIGAGAGAPAA